MSVDLTKLNPQQREAVLATEGPLLILAGAGSGKTRVLTHRVAHLVLDKGVPPEDILAITFTNKATKEMRDRVYSLVGREAGLVRIGTFHRTCLDILRANHAHLDLPARFTVLGADDAERAVSRIIKDRQIADITPRRAHSRISRAKNELVAPPDFLRWFLDDGGGDEVTGEAIADIYKRYEDKLRDAKAVDLDGLLTETYRLLRENPTVLESQQARARYIHVDEYQDTNQVQYRIVKMLGARHRNVMVVGDLDQAIYGFRGADPRIIKAFPREYPDAKVVVLGENYRSTKRIVSAADAVIRNNQDRMPKQTFTSNPEGSLLGHYAAVDDRDEADFVVKSVRSMVRKGMSPSDFAVLYRVGSLSAEVETALLRAGIRYEVVRGMRYLDRKVVRDAIAYLTVAVNPDDAVTLTRVANVPKRGLGDATLGILEGAARQLDLTLRESVRRAAAGGVSMSAKARMAVGLLDGALTRVEGHLGGELALGARVRLMLDETGLVDEATRAAAAEDAPDRDDVGDILKLADIAAAFEAESPGASLGDFLDHIALQSEADENDGKKPSVKLLTMHAAKGLEFPVVFVIGAEDGLFPHSRALVDPKNSPHLLEEERRLAYVAMTRAMKTLVFTDTARRRVHGEVRRSVRSRFLDEIPTHLVQRVKGAA